MRQAVVQATHHAHYRAAFGRPLVRHSLMQNVLADMCVESEAATLLAMRLAKAYDDCDTGDGGAFRRIATSVAKYWVCKRAGIVMGEAMECLGGNGYVEESLLPRLYRESPVNSIWEGSSNIICLDVLRAMSRTPDSVESLLGEVGLASGAEARLDAYVLALKRDLATMAQDESQARHLVSRLALALQGSLIVRHAPAYVADAFCASRLAGQWGTALGTLPAGLDFQAIIRRASAVKDE
jgi:putative acyl-CoA dehydrogenase